ncbi:MAG: hypothetical protein OEZ48_12180 [Candidatus Bathyarchaeota archaeon]|nr:hypothetical protein [Candidatus Bathyarchaeota archaeon]
MPSMVVAGMLTEMSTRIAKEAMKKAEKTIQYLLRLSFQYENAVENRNIMQSPILYVSVIWVRIKEKGKTSKPERAGRLTPHIRRSVNKPRRSAAFRMPFMQLITES